MNRQLHAQPEAEGPARFDAASLAHARTCRHLVDPRIAAGYVESGERLGDRLIDLFAAMADLHDRLRRGFRTAPKRAMQ